MSLSRLALLSLALPLAALLGGCDRAGDAGSDAGSPDAVARDTHADADTGVAILEYDRYLRVDDASQGCCGARIDAVMVRKADGSVHPATTIEGWVHGGGLGDGLDPMQALGEPDALVDWASAAPACPQDLDAHVVPLGGPGGHLVLGIPVGLEPGDEIIVLQLGDCPMLEGAASPETMVEVSAGFGHDGPWTVLGASGGLVVRVEYPPFAP